MHNLHCILKSLRLKASYFESFVKSCSKDIKSRKYFYMFCWAHIKWGVFKLHIWNSFNWNLLSRRILERWSKKGILKYLFFWPLVGGRKWRIAADNLVQSPFVFHIPHKIYICGHKYFPPFTLLNNKQNLDTISTIPNLTWGENKLLDVIM